MTDTLRDRVAAASEKWFVAHTRPHVLGHTYWYGAFHTQQEADDEQVKVQKYWRLREGMGSQAPVGFTYVVRDDDDTDLDYREIVVDTDV